jgi:hypothetical protein
VTNIARIIGFVILAIAAVQGAAQAASADCCAQAETAALMCRMPLTKSYRIQPGFCPQQLVCMIPQCVPADGSSAGCGPYGVPPIYSAGNYVLVRQTPEVHARIAKFLTDVGALVPFKPSR